jgi:hypothetical protein
LALPIVFLLFVFFSSLTYPRVVVVLALDAVCVAISLKQYERKLRSLLFRWTHDGAVSFRFSCVPRAIGALRAGGVQAGRSIKHVIEMDGACPLMYR